MASVSRMNHLSRIRRRRSGWVFLLLWTSFVCVEAARQQQQQAAFGATDNSAAASTAKPPGWNLARGGGSSGDNNSSAESESLLEEKENSTDASADSAIPNTHPTKPKLWAPGALFELNDEIKSDLSANRDDDDANENSNADEGTKANQRGGALVKTAKPRRFQWLAPLDTKRVAPAHSRLLVEEDGGPQPEEEDRNQNVPVAVVEEKKIEPEPSMAEEVSKQPDTAPLSAPKEDDDDVSVSSLKTKEEPKKKRKHHHHHKKSSHRSDSTESASTESADRKEKTKKVRSKRDENGDLASEVAKNTTSTIQEMSSYVSSGHVTSPYVSSGYWRSIDSALTLGYASSHPAWRISSRLRGARKFAAKYTGLHGVLSGKKVVLTDAETAEATMTSQHHGVIRRRLAAIDRARRNIPDATAKSPYRGFFGTKRERDGALDEPGRYAIFFQKSAREKREEARRKERVKEIDRLCVEGQRRLQELACEKDMLQRRPNPLWNYTTAPIKEGEPPAAMTDDANETANTTTTTSSSSSEGARGSLISASRTFNFPPKDLVDEYLDMLFLTSRLVKLNYTELWRNPLEDDDEDELIDDDWDTTRKRKTESGQASGNWLLRNGVGEKLGETVERLAYNAVCKSIMSILARSLSSIHGANVMTFSDIRLSVVEAPNLPPVSAGIIPGSSGSNYAKQAIANAMHRGARKNKKKRSRNRRRSADQGFIQRDAVVETLLSHCQISMPLLTMFPLAWQRALLSNIITLVTAVIADFCEGLEFQILGHKLLLSFTPLTEDDVLRGMTLQSLSRKRAKASSEFEAAVKATADDLSLQLKFLDRWHERALGSGMLRSQVANLIARLVLTLIDDVLGGARMDLWATHAGGPRLVAGLEYRTTPNYMGESPESS